ncbi:MAG: bifunctional proline dehydrogenase/L-glutamate gamma-semialdehyde dehydrogenase PutA [Acidiphilium sp.]|nr:bifunctional proline dehydrogenase/L-glutamate gamma-semialdehyde dehydrogenase PutA [Acidiphilium sp.]
MAGSIRAIRHDDTSGDPALFDAFLRDIHPETALRAAITAAYRRPESEAVAAILDEATLTPADHAQAQQTARHLITVLRARGHSGLVETLLQEYALSSQEGVALMCLAEALLRIPDTATRDTLIRDKIGAGNWRNHLGESPSLFVNAATWGLLLTGKLTATASEAGLGSALSRLLARGGEPIVRRGVNIAMRLMGEQFVMGQTIGEALNNARKREARGFLYSYDMLGEAALTAADAGRYYRDYEQAIHAIGVAAAGRGLYAGPGISVKLSALHPRYSRAQRGRVMTELAPRLTALALLARRYDIGLNIDAEEADRLDLSLDLLERLCFEPEFAGWHGIGFVVQAYQKRAPRVIDFLVDLARRSGHRLMVRLVKGAYWDSEIKRAQVDGLEGFPVYTRKIHTDVSYLACARKMLAASAEIFPQFATHNALTLASIHAMAGPYAPGRYEFQCLHGMGEALYDEVVGPQKLGVPCRIYAPVGTHETLLAYLVRRLLENGANSSFVNKLADPEVEIEALLDDPVAASRRIIPPGAGHEKISLPAAIFGRRRNSSGLDLSNEQRLAELATGLAVSRTIAWSAGAVGAEAADPVRVIVNPADRADRVGTVVEATQAAIAAALASATASTWRSVPAADRAARLERAAELLEDRRAILVGLIVREAGKTIPAALGEVREAVDFLRYYAEEASKLDDAAHRPLGVVVAISPWNFPLAIFTGQVAAALAAGNAVLAKPAEETPLIAAEAVRILHQAGVPRDAVTLVPGDGTVGAALVGDARAGGVIFTGSTGVARLIQRQLALRLDAAGHPVPLIAETGGQNAMLVDSSALLEQAVGDIVTSAFDSAGQRCSALRILLVQEDIADALITMLKGAMAELSLGRPDRLDSDIGPVISPAAREGILAHLAAMRGSGYPVFSIPPNDTCETGWFVAPTMIEIPDPAVLGAEVFGPVLHIVRYAARDRDRMIDAVNALGYGLTFGIHSRIDETIEHVTRRITAGNIYVNRNIIGAVVGVQPFGGHGMSGTGPKAGGPLYIRRLMAQHPGFNERCGMTRELQGPVGEQNIYRLQPRGTVLCHAATAAGAACQIAACAASGNDALVLCPEPLAAMTGSARLANRQTLSSERFDAVLFEGDAATLRDLLHDLARRDGPIIPVYCGNADADYPLAFLSVEQAVSINTAAAGGNASLMAIG